MNNPLKFTLIIISSMILSIPAGGTPTSTSSNRGRLISHSHHQPKIYRCGNIGNEGIVNFVNPHYPEEDDGSGECTFRLVIQNRDICQIRVDLVDTELLAPTKGKCLSQGLTIEGGIWPTGLPPICGVNNDQHFYLHLKNNGDNLGSGGNVSLVDFKVKTKAKGHPYKFGIWLTQVDCAKGDFPRAPEGCTQYFPGKSGLIKSFNFDGNLYLTNQNYRICIKPADGACGIRYDAAGGTNGFGIRKGIQIQEGNNGNLKSSGVGTSICPTDFLLIPFGQDTFETLRRKRRRDGRPLFIRRGIRRPQLKLDNKKKNALMRRRGGSIINTAIVSSEDRFCGGHLSSRGGDMVNRPIFAQISSNLITLGFRTSSRPHPLDNHVLSLGFKIKYAQLKGCDKNENEKNEGAFDMVKQPNTFRHSEMSSVPDEGTSTPPSSTKGSIVLTGNRRYHGGQQDNGWEYFEDEEDYEGDEIYDYLE